MRLKPHQQVRFVHSKTEESACQQKRNLGIVWPWNSANFDGITPSVFGATGADRRSGLLTIPFTGMWFRSGANAGCSSFSETSFL
jgi:hypothetical protein